MRNGSEMLLFPPVRSRAGGGGLIVALGEPKLSSSTLASTPTAIARGEAAELFPARNGRRRPRSNGLPTCTGAGALFRGPM